MTTLREAAVMALEALNNLKTTVLVETEISVLREALAQHEPEPVAWIDRDGEVYRMPEIKNWAPPHTMLYTAPPQREWVDLTNEEIEWIKGSANRAIGYIRVTAAKLKEKNLHIKHIRETHENTN